jgi:hypothetical protein
MTFASLWALLAICAEQLILDHAYDEYLVWHKNWVQQRTPPHFTPVAAALPPQLALTSSSTLRCSSTIPPVASTAILCHHHRSPPLGLHCHGQPDSGKHFLFQPRKPAPLVAGLLPDHSTVDHRPPAGQILPTSHRRRWGRRPPLFLPRAKRPRWVGPSPIQMGRANVEAARVHSAIS